MKTRIAEDTHGTRASLGDSRSAATLACLNGAIDATDIEKQCPVDDDCDLWFTVNSTVW